MSLNIDRVSRSQGNRFTSVRLDRLVERRDDERWVASALEAPEARYVPLWRSRNLLESSNDGTLAVYLRHGELDHVDLLQRPTLLGTDEKRTYFAINLSDAQKDAVLETHANAEFADLRRYSIDMDAKHAGILAYAKALHYWQHRHRFCGFCGTANRLRSAGHKMVCSNDECGRQTFPRIDPAIIVLIDPELRAYGLLAAVFALLATLVLVLDSVYDNSFSAARFALFQVVSALTTTGFTSTEFSSWPAPLPLLLIALAFIGGCAGSTAGGIKVIRVMLLFRHAMREIRRLVHPHAVLPVKFGGQKAAPSVLEAVMGFFFLFIASTILMTLLLHATGLDLLTAFSAVAACITNLGPGLGEVSSNYAVLNDSAKLVLSMAMLAGRLEIYTLLVLLTPTFWKD